jgi:hypothetical protein
MMEDLFSETLIKKKRTAKDLAAWLPLFCLGVLLLIGGLLVHPLLLLAGLGLWSLLHALRLLRPGIQAETAAPEAPAVQPD